MSGEEAPTLQPEQEKQPDEEPPPAASEAPQQSGSSSPAAAEEQPLSIRALVLTGYGGYDKVKLQVKTQKQQLAAGEVLVRVKACGLNFAELMGKQGLYELLPPPPVTLGMEGSGVIEAVGEDVKDRKVSEGLLITPTHT